MKEDLDPKLQYFGNSGKTQIAKIRFLTESELPKLPNLEFPTKTEISHIARRRENHIYEFKAAGTEIRDITKEIAAFSNTKAGGIIFYGISNDGTISGSDMCLQEIDQPIQNSVRNTILPSLAIDIEEQEVENCKIILIRVPAWNRRDVYQYEGRVYIKHGTNVFMAKPDEIRQLYKGIPIT